MRKMRTWLSGWAALLSIMLADRDTTAAFEDDLTDAPRPGITEDPVWALIAHWRGIARAKRLRANELGDSRAGLEAFTEATVLSACADEAEQALGLRQPGPGQEA
jgi:hypothetical protein